MPAPRQKPSQLREIAKYPATWFLTVTVAAISWGGPKLLNALTGRTDDWKEVAKEARLERDAAIASERKCAADKEAIYRELLIANGVLKALPDAVADSLRPRIQ